MSDVALVILLRADGAALLQHRDEIPGLPHAGLWAPPGGHREPGESLEECARDGSEHHPVWLTLGMLGVPPYLIEAWDAALAARAAGVSE